MTEKSQEYYNWFISHWDIMRSFSLDRMQQMIVLSTKQSHQQDYILKLID